MPKTIRQTVTFKASPHAVYETLMDSRRHAAFSGMRARISRMREREGAPRGAFIRRGPQERADGQDGPIGQGPRRLPRDPAVVRRARQAQRVEERADRSATLLMCGAHGL